eukprot:921946_1
MEAVRPDKAPCTSITELCRDKLGMMTGAISTRAITDATPAAYTSHVFSRYEADRIAFQQTQGNFDILLGGGRQYFDPKHRTDKIDLLEYMKKEKNYTLVENTDELLSAKSLPLLGLFSDEQMDFVLDRDTSVQPSLKEMTKKALEMFKDAEKEDENNKHGANKNGFFLMV